MNQPIRRDQSEANTPARIFVQRRKEGPFPVQFAHNVLIVHGVTSPKFASEMKFDKQLASNSCKGGRDQHGAHRIKNAITSAPFQSVDPFLFVADSLYPARPEGLSFRGFISFALSGQVMVEVDIFKVCSVHG